MRLLMPNVTFAPATRLERIGLPSAVDDRLYFAQVREDPRLELDGLDVGPDDSVVVVGSGGCTALSLLAAGAGRVTRLSPRISCRLNTPRGRSAAISSASLARAGRSALTVTTLRSTSRSIESGLMPGRSNSTWKVSPSRQASRLTPAACAYWDSHLVAVAGGVLGAGVTERFIRMIIAALRLFVHPRSRIERMLACESLLDQRVMFVGEWNTVRWRMYFRLLLNRAMFRRTYDPAFFAHLERPSFAEHFRLSAEHALTELPVRDNYFLHHMLTGRYPVDVPGGVPPYLSEAGYETCAAARERFSLADGTVTEYLRTLPDASVSVFSLSNICEWLAPADVEALFAEIVRTATPDARLCFRNFVGWTEVPERFRDVVVEDRAWGERHTPRDRSVVLRRVALCRIHP